MQKALSFLLGLLLICLSIPAGAVTLTELWAEMPDRLVLEVEGPNGTVSVDAPITLPKTERLPLVLVQRATFNTLELHEVYPLPEGRERVFYEASAHEVREVCESLSVYLEEKDNIIYGKTDYTDRYALPPGSLPPENQTTVAEIMGFLQENIRRFHCDATLDIRVQKAVAMSGLCEMKKERVTDGGGVSWMEFIADPEKPTKRGAKGIWELDMAQYMYGTKILDAYQPYGSYQPPNRSNYWYQPIHLFADWLDDRNLNLGVMAVKEMELLEQDVDLLPFDQVVARLEERIREGKLKSVYGFQLAYTVRIVKGDEFWTEDMRDFRLDTRFVLVPEWQILGFDEKDAATAKSVGLVQPSKEAILDPAQYSRYGLEYELRMDASTGEFILDYESQEFDLTK